jgi:predicted metal-dependent hydrolase
VRRSIRAKRIRLAVYNDGNFVVTVPKYFSSKLIKQYLIAKSKWITTKIDFFEKINSKYRKINGSGSFESNKDSALIKITERLTILNQKFYNFKYNKVTVKNQKTRWGSCSSKGNLNFNYKILFLSPKIKDYIICHELCHLKEFNHSNKFWRLVAKSTPNYIEITNELNENGLMIL